MKILWSIMCGFLLVVVYSVNGMAAESGLQPWDRNPWYWSYHGEPVLLLGGSDDDNLFQWPERDLLIQLDRMAAAGANLIRNTMGSRKDKGFEVFPFKHLTNGKYDLNQWNEEYWIRFERMLHETAKRRIMVQIEIWDPWDYTGKEWSADPYNPRNNINYSTEESGLGVLYEEPAYANKQPFFFTTPGQRNNQVVLQFQQRLVDKLLDYSLRYDHVLYCIDNETSGEEAWSRFWATYVKRRAKQENRVIFVTEMWDDWDVTTAHHRRTFDHPNLYDFVEVSQNNHQRGQKHWEQFLRARHYLANRPRPINTIKIYGADGQRFGNDQDGIERFWRNLLAGSAAFRFHCPKGGLGLNDEAVAAIRGARKLESQIPLWTVEPVNELLVDPKPNHAYLSGHKGHAFALYLPAGGEVHIDMSEITNPMVVRWIEIATGEWGPEQRLSGRDTISLKSPGSGNWAAAITVENRKQAD